MFEENNQHAREIPGQCQQRDFTQVPAEFDLFQSHRHYSCGRSDNQQAAAHAGAESQQVPEDTVLYERLHISRVEARGQGCRIGDGVHTHTGSHQRHVIDYGRQQTGDSGDRIDFVYVFVQEVGEVGQQTGALQCCDRHQNTQEEEDRGHYRYV